MWRLLVAASVVAAALWALTVTALVAERIHQHRKARP